MWADQQMGNSEVGHLTIGAGRIIRQELVRISDTSGTTSSEPRRCSRSWPNALPKATAPCICWASVPTVAYSHVDHLCGLIRGRCGRNRVAVHAVTDGRDTPTQSALNYIQKVESTRLKRASVCWLACGRYWAMDRTSAERTEKAYDLYTDPGCPVEEQSPVNC